MRPPPTGLRRLTRLPRVAFQLSIAPVVARVGFSSVLLAAQTPTQPAPPPAFEIRGKITDTSNAPLPRASVTLRLKGSPVTIAGAIAGRDGSFRVTGLRPATFTIRVFYIGYAPVIQDITLTPKTPILDLGVAKLAPIATTLDAVKVQKSARR
jgi:hypothetical protein